MFGLLTDAIDNALDVADRLMSGEDVSRRQVSKLASDAIAITTGAVVVSEGVELLQDLLSEGER